MSYSGYFKGEKRKLKKKKLEKKAQTVSEREVFILPTIEIIKKGKNEAE